MCVNYKPCSFNQTDSKYTRKERFCRGIWNFAGYRSENNFVGSSK